ncbi:uncharacterized protein LOC129739201 isoform X2 [Uranotaenia lowii]|uniref:uncharacterized protein LOC129739201 isoform X2 n=1 Tax=Uranotaenia lowii TaxID=190385 RepID=UPI0024793D7F|nr:uncharacterized protein LOC129739201 isoform X2 [Uranotaenia lowii]
MSFAKMIAYRSSMPLGSVGCEGVSTTQRLLDEQSLFPTIAGDRDISKINFQQIKTVQGFCYGQPFGSSLTAALEIFGPEIFLDCNAKGLSTTLAITVLSALEFLLLLLVHVTYIVKVCVFNALQQPPDALVAQTDNGPAGGRCPTIINNQEQPLGPEEFITQQFLMIAKRMDDNRHLQDKIREYRSTAPMINSESTHLSMANQSLIEL